MAQGDLPSPKRSRNHAKIDPKSEKNVSKSIELHTHSAFRIWSQKIDRCYELEAIDRNEILPIPVTGELELIPPPLKGGIKDFRINSGGISSGRN